MKKNLLILFFLSIFSLTAYAASFHDINKDDLYFEAVEFLFEEGVISGDLDGNFRPYDFLNRAEFLKILTEAVFYYYNLDKDLLDTYEDKRCFSDVGPGLWYTKYICYAMTNGWVLDYSDGQFKASEPISFVDSLKVLYKAFEMDYVEGNNFWYENLADDALLNNYLPITIISFSDLLRRDEMADMIARFIKKNDGELDNYLGELKAVNRSHRRDSVFIYESNLIEDLVEIEYINVLEDIVNKTSGGHVAAWLYMRDLAEKKKELQMEDLDYIHKLIMDEQLQYGHSIDTYYIGVIRDYIIQIAWRVVMAPSEEEFNAFFANLNNEIKELDGDDVDKLLKFAAMLHYDYEEIHPYADGNGRTGRLIVNYVLAYFGYEPLIINSVDVENYYKCFRERGGSHKAITAYFIEKYKENNAEF